ncbi:MAG: hypothetical protein CME71_02570 [Halobacteriovorax sp.]|nr:hypothetical protein [Halobacteriovorax sp.]
MKFLVWNLENFFLVPHLKSSYNQPLKPQKKVEQIVSVIEDLDPDVLFLSEVGGEDSLIKLEKMLKSNYQYFYTEGNSDRGIGIAFLVKQPGYKLKFYTHTDDILPAVSLEDRTNPRKFSRDAAELWLCDETGKPKLILWGVHLKSGQDRTGADPKGFRQRSAEVRGLVTLIKKRRSSYPEVTQWMVGDFNGNAAKENTSAEFEHLYAQLPDYCDLLERLDVPTNQRWTFAMAYEGNNSLPSQLDYFFIPNSTPTPDPEGSAVVQLWQRLGNNAGPAKTTSERETWPSDHLPILASWPKCPF